MTLRPPQWQASRPIPVVINFPGIGSVAPYLQDNTITAILPQGQTYYAFDAVIGLEHVQEIEVTRHPVQSGASISDHAYVIPARLTLDVGMSDVLDSFEKPDTWSGSTSKSVAAYQTMLALQQSRIPLSLTTRLRTYNNMVVRSINPHDTVKTYAGLRMFVVFEQIILANISTPISNRPQDTNFSLQGSINPIPPSPSITSQNNIFSLTNPSVPAAGVIGSGSWSSDSTSLLNSLPPG